MCGLPLIKTTQTNIHCLLLPTSYGDKTPKSIIARLFSVLWIMIGVTMCSILTATLSSALTSVTVERYDFTTGKTVNGKVNLKSTGQIYYSSLLPLQGNLYSYKKLTLRCWKYCQNFKDKFKKCWYEAFCCPWNTILIWEFFGPPFPLWISWRHAVGRKQE